MKVCEICKSGRIKFFHQIGKFCYSSCANCKTLFLNPKPTVRDINNYYKKSFEYTAGGTNEKEIRKRAKLILNKLIKINPDGKTLLDIGSGYGYFLDEATKKGLNVSGIEPSRKLHAISLYRYNEVVVNTNLEHFYKKEENKKYDFITLIHTIEHVTDPKETINKAFKLLNPNGILYLETPNLDSHLFNTEKENYTFLTPPDHIWLFSKYSFLKIFSEIANSDILEINSYSYPEHFMGIIKGKLEIRSTESETNHKYQNYDTKDNRTFNFKNLNFEFVSSFGFKISDLKYLLFDKLIAQLLTPLLNLGIYGSILELYVRKK